MERNKDQDQSKAQGYEVNIPGITVSRSPINEKEAAVYLGMSVKWLQQARCYGFGPKFLKLGRSVRYLTKDLDAYIASRTVNPAA